MKEPSFELFCGNNGLHFKDDTHQFTYQMKYLTKHLIELNLFPQFSLNCYKTKKNDETQGFVFLQTQEGFCKTIIPLDYTSSYEEKDVWCVIKYRGQKLNEKQMEDCYHHMNYIFETEEYDKYEDELKNDIKKHVESFNLHMKNLIPTKRENEQVDYTNIQ